MAIQSRPRFWTRALTLAGCLVAVLHGHAEEPAAYRTPPEVKARLQRMLPNSYEKLSKRQALNVIVVGDDLANMSGHGEIAGDQLQAWPAQFVMELAREFAYNGGIRLASPNSGKPDKSGTGAGPEIGVRIVPVTGSVLRKALSAFTAYASAPGADILVVAASSHDAMQGGDLMHHAESLHALMELAAASKTDLVLAGPTVNGAEPTPAHLASISALGSLMRDAAEEAGAGFADLADLASIIRFNDDQLTSDSCLDYVTKQLRQQFVWPSSMTDWQHPVPLFHRRLSALAYKHLTAGTMAVPWKVQPGFASVDDHIASISFEINNPTQTPLVLTAQPLSLPAWTTEDKAATLALKPGETLKLSFTYKHSGTGESSKWPPFAGHEPILRVPVFIATATAARIEDLRATIRPVVMLWKLDALFNQSGTFTIDNMLVNTSDKDISDLEWNAEWSGQKKQGKVTLQAGKGSTLPITFDLPKDAGARRMMAPVSVSVSGHSIRMNWMRPVEASQNIGLEQDVPLVSSPGSQSTAQMRIEARDKTASFLFDLAGMALQNDTSGTALRAELHLDARSYGKRLGIGSTEPITALMAASDGEGRVLPVSPWAFGTGYGMKFDENGIAARLGTSSTGHRLLSITIPRSYLYLHEWALGNGNSQFGLCARLTATKTGESFELSLNGRERDDAESHTVLELTPKPTSRWTVILW